MTDLGNSDLYVATYDEPYDALRDFRALEALAAHEDLQVFGVVVMSRHDDGKVDVLAAAEDAGEEGAGEEGTDWFGGSTGIVVGLFAPELLLATPAGTGASSALPSLIRAHHEGRLGVDLDAFFPPESAAVVLVVAHTDTHRVDGALLRAREVASCDVQDEYYRLLRNVLDCGGDAADI